MRTPAGSEVTVTGPFPACAAERTVTSGAPAVACGPVTFSIAGTAGEQIGVGERSWITITIPNDCNHLDYSYGS